MADQQAAGGTIWPVILAGGTGTRLWPMSRSLFPKQFMALASPATMLQSTAERLTGPSFHAPVLLCNDEHRFIVAEQLREADLRPEAIVLEPVGRNTAPAAAIAALMLAERDPEAVMLLSPADHVIEDLEAFQAAIACALPAARDGMLITFGIRPSGPETGYGYIEKDGPLDGVPGCFAIARFTEKPDAETARSYVASGDHFWNSGIFLLSASGYLAELERHAPKVLPAARDALTSAREDLDFLRLDGDALAASPSISIDYAVMEHTGKGAVVPVDMGWSDVGSWTSLWDISDKDSDGNVTIGDIVSLDARDSYLRSERPLIAAIGVKDLIVIATDDAILVADRSRSQDVKNIVETLARDGRAEPMTHTTVYRPWGSFQSVDVGERFQVKRITVKPGGRLSLQKHAQRAEHWVVVGGTATVTRDEDILTVHENESVFIPIGMAHRLENRTDQPLYLIEVQSGSYLGEDDIVRFEDIYGRS